MQIADRHLRQALVVIDEATAGMSADDLAWQRAGAWSTGEILEHLSRTYASTAHIFRKCLRDDEPKGRRQTARQRLFTFMVLRVGYFPSGIKSPALVEPQGLPPTEALHAARRELVAFDQAATACAERFGPRARVANHPLLGGFTTDQWRRFHWRHTRHHMRQITVLNEARRLALQSR